MRQKVIVHKCDAQGGELWAYPGVILELNERSALIEAVFDLAQVELGLLTLVRGDRFAERYYFDRWFNIFTVYAGEQGMLKGWYCNLARPATLDDGHLYAEDLALDLVRLPDGRMQLLDGDEFTALNLTQEERQRSLDALDMLRWQIYQGEDPFGSVG